MTQQEALDVLKTGNNVFLTGSAGSGKTYVINRYIDYLKVQNKKVGITASTGVAATHINGITLHAWAGIGARTEINDIVINDLLQRKYLRDRFSKTDVLIIDEVSMLSAQTFGAVDTILQAFRDNDEPFGGMQVVLCGDFFQLPPIEKTLHLNSSSSSYVYRAPVWKLLDIKVCYLDKIYRQVDDTFLNILNQIRQNNITKDVWDTLKHRFFHSFYDGVSPTRLYTHNAQADKVNNQELAKLDGIPKTYHMKSRGNDILANIMKKNCLAPEQLILKKQALVMFVKNNYEEGYANGTMGRVIDFTEKEGYPIVRMFNKKELIVRPSEWTIEEEGESKATIQQIPLRLAWAITIHKSQGMTLDAAEIDLGKSFVTGMGYVALSRVKSLNGIRLRSLNRTALTVSDEIIKVDKRLQQMSAEVVQELHNSSYYKINKEN